MSYRPNYLLASGLRRPVILTHPTLSGKYVRWAGFVQVVDFVLHDDEQAFSLSEPSRPKTAGWLKNGFIQA